MTEGAKIEVIAIVMQIIVDFFNFFDPYVHYFSIAKKTIICIMSTDSF